MIENGTKLRAKANGGVVLTITEEAGQAYNDAEVGGANVEAVTSLSTTGYLLALVGGVIKKILSPFVVDSSANVGIGMTPDAKLSVAGTVKTTGQFFSAKVMGGVSGELYQEIAKFLYYNVAGASGNWAGTGTAGSGAIWFRTGYTTGYEFWMLPTGQFGFGTPTVTAGYKGEFNGAIKVTKMNCGSRIDHGVLASAPSGPAQGDHYFNSTDKIEYFYNGTEWKAAYA